MRLWLRVWVIMLCVDASPEVFAAEGNAAAGKVKSELCQSCHGVNGKSTDPTVPSLAGQHPAYILKQIYDFQMENRSDPRMSPIAHSLVVAQDVRDIAVFFAAQPTMRGTLGKNAQVERGRSIFESGIPARNIGSCIQCHGPNGKGSSQGMALFPVIGGQNKTYLLKQLNDFKAFKRNTDPSGVMAGLASQLKPEELDAVAEYLAGM